MHFLTPKFVFQLGLAIFLILGMVIDHSYSVGAGLMLLASLYTVIKYRRDIGFKQFKAIPLIWALYALVCIVVVIVGGHTSRDFEPAVRFLSAIPIFYTVIYWGISRVSLLASFALGGIAMGGFALYQRFALHIDRVGEWPIHFGGVGILTAFFCLWSLFFIPEKSTRPWLWKSALMLGMVGGFVASLLSGSRGGWIFIVVALPIIAYGLNKQSKKAMRTLFTFVVGGVMTSGIIYFIPSTGVADRVQLAIQETSSYHPGEDSALSSIGARLDTWRRSLVLIQERPLTGWGIKGYRARMQQMKEESKDRMWILNHLHNDMLNDLVKRGIFSLLVLVMGLYIFPCYRFAQQISAKNKDISFFAVLGVLSISAWFIFGLTNNFLERNQMIQYYLVYLSVFFGGMLHLQRNPFNNHCTKATL